MEDHEHRVHDDPNIISPPLHGVHEIGKQTTALLLAKENVRRDIASHCAVQHKRVRLKEEYRAKLDKPRSDRVEGPLGFPYFPAFDDSKEDLRHIEPIEI